MTKYEARKLKDSKRLDKQLTKTAKNLLKELGAHLKQVEKFLKRKDKKAAETKARQERRKAAIRKINATKVAYKKQKVKEEALYQEFFMAVEKQCVKCELVKHTDEFPMDPNTLTQRRSCRPCWAAFVESHRI